MGPLSKKISIFDWLKRSKTFQKKNPETQKKFFFEKIEGIKKERSTTLYHMTFEPKKFKGDIKPKKVNILILLKIRQTQIKNNLDFIKAENSSIPANVQDPPNPLKFQSFSNKIIQ